MLAEKGEGVFVLSIQLYDIATGKDVDTLSNTVSFFARIIERDGEVFVSRGDFEDLIPFDSKAEARQYIDVLFALEHN